MKAGDGDGRRAAPTQGMRGSVTAETALVIPVLVGVAGLLLWLLAAGVSQVRCIDAARDAARALARDEPEPRVLAAAREMAPKGAVVDVDRVGDAVQVRISYEATLPGNLLDQVVSIPISATSSMPVEVGTP